MPTFIDLKGEKFGRLTVVERVGSRGDKTVWKCVCACGATTNVAAGNLRSKQSTSCGCYHIERIRRPDAAFNRVVTNYRNSARRRGLVWALDTTDVKAITVENCHWCNREPSNVAVAESGQTFTYNGLDRVDNAIGYTLRNVVACCAICNIMKRHHSAEEFVGHARRIVAHQDRTKPPETGETNATAEYVWAANGDKT